MVEKTSKSDRPGPPSSAQLSAILVVGADINYRLKLSKQGFLLKRTTATTREPQIFFYQPIICIVVGFTVHHSKCLRKFQTLAE